MKKLGSREGRETVQENEKENKKWMGQKGRDKTNKKEQRSMDQIGKGKHDEKEDRQDIQDIIRR